VNADPFYRDKAERHAPKTPKEVAAAAEAGCKLLRDLAQEFSNFAATLSALVAGVEAEDNSNLQDWLAQAAALEQLGCTKEFAHGNR
jgi:hypothetical protein